MLQLDLEQGEIEMEKSGSKEGTTPKAGASSNALPSAPLSASMRVHAILSEQMQNGSLRAEEADRLRDLIVAAIDDRAEEIADLRSGRALGMALAVL